MLILKSCCENCHTLLPANSTEAYICSFECTFCKDCVDNVLMDICPNCGGNFQCRPIRPALNFKNNNFLGEYPPEEGSIYKPVDATAHQIMVEKVTAANK